LEEETELKDSTRDEEKKSDGERGTVKKKGGIFLFGLFHRRGRNIDLTKEKSKRGVQGCGKFRPKRGALVFFPGGN